MNDHQIREALTQHWTASDAGDFEMEHSIYHEDAILEYPQSAERIRGRNNIQMTRTLQPDRSAGGRVSKSEASYSSFRPSAIRVCT